MDLKGFKPKKLSGKKTTKKQGKILATVQMAVDEDNGIFPSEMTVYFIDGQHYVVMHDNSRVPSYDEVEQMEMEFYKKVAITSEESNIIVNAIHLWEKVKHYHLNPYNVVVLACLMKNLDLIQRKIIQL